MTIIPCPPYTRGVEELPSLDLTADSDSVPAIERRTSTSPDTAEDESEPSKPRHRRARLLTSLAAIAALGLVVYTLRDKLPSVHSVSAAFAGARLSWVLAAAVLEAVSLSMFASQQRALLAAMSVRMSAPRALGVTYARSAIAISLPAGSAVSAAFAYQQYRRSGASRDNAAAVMVLSGIASFVGIALLYIVGVAGFLVVSPGQAWSDHSELIVAVGAVTATGLITWLIVRRRQVRHGLGPRLELVAASDDSRVRQWTARAVITVRANMATWRDVRPRQWIAALTYAMLNWLLDLLCLAAATAAFRLHVGILTLASIYLGVQLVRQVPITPGGIGLIETGLLAGFAAIGTPAATAAAVVLTYRVLSCWVLIPIGGLAWLGLRTATPAPPELTQSRIAPPELTQSRIAPPEIVPSQIGPDHRPSLHSAKRSELGC